MDPTAKQSIIDRLQQANNVLVTVKKDPNVDQLAACIGLTLFLNKLGKHATAVFSGKVPSTIEFLKPEDTIEKNTDSLRDFIIALDKSKADKLRYKVEDKIVKIFITPYRTSLSEKDLDFSQGDFNVDVVMALGVEAQTDIDAAITAHGRILHDATVISVDNKQGGNIGTLHLEDTQASSISESIVELCEQMKPDSFDGQMATSFLTGIVAETERYSNTKTSPRTMTMSAKLMAAGANQQLIATKLQPHQVASGKIQDKAEDENKDKKDDDGTLTIEHDETKEEPETTLPEPVEQQSIPQPEPEPLPPRVPEPPSTPIGDVKAQVDDDNANKQVESDTKRPSQEPEMGGTLTANTQQRHFEPSTDPLTNAHTGQTLQHSKPEIDNDPTLSQIEKEVDSPHIKEIQSTEGLSKAATSELDEARQAVEAAATESTDTITPLKAVGSQPIDMDVQGQHAQQTPPQDTPAVTPQNGSTPDFMKDKGLPPEESGNGNEPPSPPPVPPPLMPPNPPQK